MNEGIPLTKEMKLEAWGPGEWVDEPDFLKFKYKKTQCVIIRVAIIEGNSPFLSLGHLCGYVEVPAGHHWIKENPFEIGASAPGGINYGEYDSNERYFIGFDCAHYRDVVPSVEKTHERIANDFKMKFPHICPNSRIFHRSYKNIAFVKSACKSLVRQMLAAKEVHNG